MHSLRETNHSFMSHNQQGSALIVSILIILVLTVIGIYAVTTSSIDTQITGYQRLEIVAFNSAEAAMDYTITTFRFGEVDKTNKEDPIPPNSNLGYKFEGKVNYYGKTVPPPGSGTGQRAGFRSHYHRVETVGSDESETAHSTIHLWGYRIGFDD